MAKLYRVLGEKSDRIAGINNRSDCREHALPRIIQCHDVFHIQPGVNKVNDRLLFRVKHSDLIYIVWQWTFCHHPKAADKHEHRNKPITFCLVFFFLKKKKAIYHLLGYKKMCMGKTDFIFSLLYFFSLQLLLTFFKQSCTCVWAMALWLALVRQH